MNIIDVYNEYNHPPGKFTERFYKNIAELEAAFATPESEDCLELTTIEPDAVVPIGEEYFTPAEKKKKDAEKRRSNLIGRKAARY